MTTMKKCNFDSKSSEDILEQLSLKNKAANNTEGYTKLVTETRKNYNNIEIEYLLKNYEIKNKHYTDESIKNFVTLFIAIGAFVISVFKETHGIFSVGFVFVITLVASIIVIAFRAFSPKGGKLNDAIFLLKQAKELEESSKEIKNKIETQGFEINLLTQNNDDFISLTDIAKFKNLDAPKDTNTIQEFLIPDGLTKKQIGYAYASEADLLNVALFGMTAKEFKEKEPEKSKHGNQRDYATIEQNIIMINLQNSNALLIEQGLEQSERLKTLRHLAVKQLETLTGNKAVQRIKDISDKQDNILLD